MRLSKYLSRAGVSSRRKAEELIRQGEVKVNGKVVTLPQEDVSPEDEIRVSGESVELTEEYIYILLNKPEGYVTTMYDPGGRPTVKEFLKECPYRVYPVGRLDRDVSGVLLFTNDGELAHRLTHPSFEVPKTYRVEVKGIPSDSALENLSNGVELEEGKTAPARVSKVGHNNKGTTLLDITLHQGWKRQVKRMCRVIGHPVLKMKRIKFAFLETGHLSTGAFRYLNPQEAKKLRQHVNLD